MDAHPRPPQAPELPAPGATYLVECFWPGVTRGHLESAVTKAGLQSSATCLELILVPEDEIVLGIFLGPSRAAVSDACQRVGLPGERIVETVRVRPAGD